MHLKKDRRPDGRTFLTIVKTTRDPKTKKNVNKVIQKVGYLENLLSEYPDPIAHFTEVAKKLTAEEKASRKILEPATLPLGRRLPANGETRSKLIGHLVLAYYYYYLKLDKFFINRQQGKRFEFDLNKIFQLLVYLRVLSPGSKRSTVQAAKDYHLKMDVKEHDVYRALEHFAGYKKALLRWIHESIRERRGRNLKNVYYDVTNYYFESEAEDYLRKPGYSKEHRTSPIVQMGLLMDNSGIPISYRLFPGNTVDGQTLMTTLDELKDEFNLGRIIVVGDKGINTGENIAYHILNKNGYVYSKSVRGASAETKKYILDESDYVSIGNGFKIKSRIVSAPIYVTDINNKRKQVDIEQKQVIIFSEKYAARARHLREEQLLKAQKNIKQGKTKPVNGSYGFIDEVSFDPATGELISLPKTLILNEEKADSQAQYDGYYMLVTSELKLPDKEVLETYKGLWRIEDAFRITKSELETRPIYLQKENHIEAHFLTCFTALTMLRLLKQDLPNIPIHNAIDAMKRMRMFPEATNVYGLDYNCPIVEEFSKICKVDFGQERITQGDLRTMIATIKKAL